MPERDPPPRPEPPGAWRGTPGEQRRRRGFMPDARRYGKCSECGDLIWFDSWDVAPQAVRCSCNATLLTEGDITGPSTTPSQAEIDYMEGVGPEP